MKILITGISGFLGRHLVDYYYSMGYQIYGVSRDIESSSALFGEKVTEVRSTLDASILDELQIDIVIHTAGIAHDTTQSAFSEDDYFRVNYGVTATYYSQFLLSTANTFIYLSSIKAAIDHTTVEIDETVVPQPATPYGRSKLKAEGFILSTIPDDKHVFIIRPCLIFGPGNKGNLDLLFKLVKKGIPYPLGAFSNKRSFIYIQNFLFGINRLLEAKAPSGIYHFCDEKKISTVDIVRIMADTLGKKPRIIAFPRALIRVAAKAGDALGLFFNSHTLQKMTENMEVSNQKLKDTIRAEFPYSLKEGFYQTFKSEVN